VYFGTRLVDFHAKDVIARAEGMGKANVARLLQGRFGAVGRYGSQLPWILSLNHAVQLLSNADRTQTTGGSMQGSFCEEALTRQKILAVTAAVTEYLGVSEVLRCLDPKQQYLCSQNHYIPGLGHEKDCQQTSGHLRRNESALDWALLTAVHLGEVSTARCLLDEHRLQFDTDLELPASLQLAARCGNETLLRLLLAAGANINSLGHSGDDFVDVFCTWNSGSVLEAACTAGHTHIVEILLSPCYDLATSGWPYEAAIIFAAHSKVKHRTSTNTVRLLMTRATSWEDFTGFTQEIFEMACSIGDEELARLVIELAPFDLNLRMSGSNKTGLCIASENGHANIVAFILTLDDTRRDKSEQEYDWRRAIRGAFQCGRPQAAAALWDALDIDLTSQLLCEAARYGQVNMIEFLLAKGVDLSSAYRNDPSSGNTYGEMALITAAREAQEPATRFLLELGIRTDKIRPFSCWRSRGPEDAGNCQAVEKTLLEYGLGPVPSV
jgi:ankyrin repeat protein